MKSLAMTTGALIASLTLSLPLAALAQYPDNHHDDYRRGDDHHHEYVRHDDWRKGHRIPRQDWDRGERVDWRSHHLRTPPRGYEWREVDGNYVLAAVATGIIASAIIASTQH